MWTFIYSFIVFTCLCIYSVPLTCAECTLPGVGEEKTDRKTCKEERREDSAQVGVGDWDRVISIQAEALSYG